MKSRVLVVDDSAMDRQLIGALVDSENEYTVEYAEDGRRGLESVRRTPPDLVITDLQMPEMNGLELVEALREEFPRLPVVLVTAQGSEEIAVQALREGAASYVSKRQLADKLVETVEHVLEVAARRGAESRVFGHLKRSEVAFVLTNDETLFPALVRFLQEMLLQTGVCDAASNLQVGVAVDEALSNAMLHGNLEIGSEIRESDPHGFWQLAEERKGQAPYRDRRIHVDATFSPDGAQVRIRDEGPGFDHGSLPDPSLPENLERVSGRGVFLMRTFLDRVEFNNTGNEVTLTKRRSPAAS